MGMFGVFPAIFLIPNAYRFMPNEKLISTGCFIYSVAILFITNGSFFLYYIAGFLFGVGWGVIYTLGPIIVSRLSSDSDRANNFSYISACNMLGAGLSPVLVKYLDAYEFSMYNIYYFACFLSLLAGFLFLFCGYNDEKENSSFEKGLSTLSFNTVVSTKAIIPMVMVFLGACIFSSMMNFQALIADSKNLDFSY
ncbi:MFS transporter, partial [Salmonella enterica]|nr:MFS transporter [Salmonella enterica]